jgi:hypothetical protein
MLAERQRDNPRLTRRTGGSKTKTREAEEDEKEEAEGMYVYIYSGT